MYMTPWGRQKITVAVSILTDVDSIRMTVLSVAAAMSNPVSSMIARLILACAVKVATLKITI